MSSAIMSKVWNLFGMDQAEDEEENDDVYEYDYDEEPEEEKKSFIKKNSKVVAMPQNQSIRMVISQPTSFEQSEEICGFLKETTMSKLVRKIGLVAHDAMKKDLIEWVLWNSERLIGHKFYCTGTTGTLIREALIR